MKTILCLVGLLLACLALVSCTALGGPSAADMSAKLAEVMADNAVTQGEIDELNEMYEEAKESAQGADWGAILGTAGATLLAGLLGLRVLPNSAIIGRPEADRLSAETFTKAGEERKA